MAWIKSGTVAYSHFVMAGTVAVRADALKASFTTVNVLKASFMAVGYRCGVETWRLIAAGLIAVAGIVLVLLTMAKVRERKGSTNGSVALSGAITFTVLVLLCVLVITVLSPPVVWGLVVVVGVTVTVMLLAS